MAEVGNQERQNFIGGHKDSFKLLSFGQHASKCNKEVYVNFNSYVKWGYTQEQPGAKLQEFLEYCKELDLAPGDFNQAANQLQSKKTYFRTLTSAEHEFFLQTRMLPVRSEFNLRTFTRTSWARCG